MDLVESDIEDEGRIQDADNHQADYSRQAAAVRSEPSTELQQFVIDAADKVLSSMATTDLTADTLMDDEGGHMKRRFQDALAKDPSLAVEVGGGLLKKALVEDDHYVDA